MVTKPSISSATPEVHDGSPAAPGPGDKPPAPWAHCRDCGVTLQSRVARYCVSCFRARQRKCDECLTDKGSLKKEYHRKPARECLPGEPALPVCPKCQNARVYLFDGGDNA